ncbi:MAG: ATP-dependent sacrificial sulfur transferase LarE [Desulfosalsimonadaceae bacterium]|nr:ATP-dependent sacrificial sulfur transferase LarE [Desulfosalsimonadaceae bacterium]
MQEMHSKKQALEYWLEQIGPLAVAFSGGVDSTFLLVVAANVISDRDKLLAVTEASPLHPGADAAFARDFAETLNVHHVTIDAGMMIDPEFTANPPNRCYLCKRAILDRIIETAENFGIRNVAHGVNVDDLGDFRPGMKAARELNIHAPLVEAGFTKQDIRRLSREMGLPTWNKPSSGCLATRIPYGQSIDLKKIQAIAASEAFLRTLEFGDCRVRHYGELAKIEVSIRDADRLRAPGIRHRIVKAFREIGFLYVSLDLEDFGSGRLNRSIPSDLR